jgi:protein-S-isoprenylcysteine O-methyltransferase Ste14
MRIFGLDIENGWILGVVFLVVSMLPMAFGGKASKRLTNFSWSSTRAKVISVLISLLFLVFVVYPFFLTIQVGTLLFWVGLGLYVLSAVAALASFYTYFSTDANTLITEGLYKISRNPIYVFLYLMVVGIGLMCHSWFLIVLMLVHMVLQHFIILEEERYCLETYGETYARYKQAVPRYLFFF